ncbi:RidA family protein [Paenibacillus contaminans]|uniref:RidA family protein n=1 Tax=Paenibacillus contaminans TaxID=450362 RepID=A0A329LVC9_9BACL|nr:RidA family protein [Paenibacillus contaminans]RAV11759.1 RidA family protein [Paenibacillus contaminans]
MAQIEKRIQELGIELPPSPVPLHTYIPCNQSGNLLYLSGQVCFLNGQLVLMHEGKLGREVTIEQGQEAARQCILNCLAAMKGYLGDLDRVVKIVKMLAFVSSAPDFNQQPVVINAASDLLIEIFGENGKHARSAIGTNELPLNTPVEIELIVEIRD